MANMEGPNAFEKLWGGVEMDWRLRSSKAPIESGKPMWGVNAANVSVRLRAKRALGVNKSGTTSSWSIGLKNEAGSLSGELLGETAGPWWINHA